MDDHSIVSLLPPVTEGFHRLVRALGVNGPPPRGEILLPVGSARLRINLSEAEGGRPGKLLLECAVAREAVQQDQALRACMLRNMSTALTRWVYLNQRRTIVLRASIPVPSHRDLVWSVPLAATAATLMAREAATEGAAVAQDAGGLSSTPYDPTGTLPELATMLATAPWEPSPNTLRMCSEGLHSLSLTQSPHGLCAEFPFPQFSQSKDTTLSGLVVTPDVATLRLAVHVTHPLAGPGILVVTTVPVHHEKTTMAARILNELNRVERKRSVKTIGAGAWCLEPQVKRFAHVSFWPAARVDQSMVPDLLGREESRIHWVHRILKSMGEHGANG